LRKFNKGGKKLMLEKVAPPFKLQIRNVSTRESPIFNATVIRKTVYSFCRVEKQVPPVLG
jgi:hypothetical protein